VRAWLATDGGGLAGAGLIEIHTQQQEFMLPHHFSQGSISKKFAPYLVRISRRCYQLGGKRQYVTAIY
jgi:hypothetical protein